MKRILLAGLGVRGGQWRQAILSHPGAELMGVVELRADLTADFDMPLYDTIEDGLRDQPDVVVIATPPSTHLDLVSASLVARVPVLCEKPLSESLDEAWSLSNLADKTNTTLLVGMNFRYVPASRAKQRIVAESTLGEPLFGQLTYIRDRDGTRRDLNSYPLTMEDPMLVEQSIHHLDLMRYVYGREVDAVSAMMWNPTGSVYQSNSCVAAILRFESDLTVSYLGTWTSGAAGFDFRWRTDFQEGIAIQPDQFGDLFISHRDRSLGKEGPLFDSVGERLKPLRVGPSVPFEDDTAALLRSFLDVVEGSETGPTARDHLLTLNLLECIREASREGKTVDVIERARSFSLL